MATQSRKEILEAKQCVILKGRRDGISIFLDDKAEFELIKDMLRKKVSGSRNFFDGAKATVNFKGRKLSQREEEILLDIIQFETNLSVAVTPDKVAKPTELKLIPLSPPGMMPTESNTYYYHGGIRSGQTIRQNGSVVVLGDVNPGGEIKASGNIIILGSLKGSAWAGAPGEDTGEGGAGCFVAAQDFRPTQIRIARVVTYIAADESQHYGSGAWAYIQDGTINIASL